MKKLFLLADCFRSMESCLTFTGGFNQFISTYSPSTTDETIDENIAPTSVVAAGFTTPAGGAIIATGTL